MISPENVHLDKIKLIDFNFNFKYILFYTFYFYKKLRGVQYWLIKT